MGVEVKGLFLRFLGFRVWEPLCFVHLISRGRVWVRVLWGAWGSRKI